MRATDGGVKLFGNVAVLAGLCMISDTFSSISTRVAIDDFVGFDGIISSSQITLGPVQLAVFHHLGSSNSWSGAASGSGAGAGLSERPPCLPVLSPARVTYLLDMLVYCLPESM